MELTRSEKNSMGIKEIAKNIRQTLKKDFPKCKFSVTISRYSGGQSMSLYLMKAPFKPFNEVGEEDSTRSVNHFYIKESKFLTDEGKKVMARAYELTQGFNWDNSDSQIDYFDVNFYVNLFIGKWDKPFEMVK